MLVRILLKVFVPLKSATLAAETFLLARLIKNNLSKTKEELKAITESSDAFRKKPNEIAETLLDSNSKYKETVTIYFMLKQVSALYEAEDKRIAIQVMNEFRNALDHFARSMIHPEEESREQDHIEKMNQHLQRAFLDTSKLLCALYDDKTKGRHRKFSDTAIGLVDTGDYQKEFTRLQVAAHSAFTEAKLLDYKLGSNVEKSVQDAYVEAVLSHQKLDVYQLKNYHKLKWAAARLTLMQGVKWIAAIWCGVIAGVLLEHYKEASKYLQAILNFFN